MERIIALGLFMLVCPAISNAIGQSGNTIVPPDADIEVGLELKQGLTTNDLSEADGIITVKNIGKKTVKVQSLNNRMVVAFVVLNEHGNVIQPVGIAKVDPRFQEKSLESNSQFSEVFKGLKFITGTGQFGYNFKKGESYRVVAIYRPWGPGGVGICSKEKTIGLK
ncbi:MAG: hypothetical protein LHV69_09675 [Elusimicrobia bacterium]|nr:hypothetical protein [Candidatus Obscuribacterium magneticum]